MSKPSILEKTIQPVGSAVSVPEPPYHLTEEQAAIWNAVVWRMPVDWFPPEVQPFLAQYCQHMTTANRLSQWITDLETDETLDPLDPLPMKRLADLCKMRDREVKACSSLATKLRFTTQSTRSIDSKKPPMIDGGKPWQS